MTGPRLKFFLALALFATWTLGLGAMAFLSANRPQPRVVAPVPR